jgi:hypothetical protein
LARCVAEVDMVAGTVALFDPLRYALPEQGHWEELTLHGRIPCVRADFEDKRGLFKLDTGAAGDSVTFHYQAVHDLGLAGTRETSAGLAGGVGGMVGTREGQLATFRLGGHAFQAVQASFAMEDTGAFADDYVSGNIGGELLKPFRLVFDYPGERIGFVSRD